MLAFIKRKIFGGKAKTAIAPQIFFVLCFYAAFTIIYGYLVVDVKEMLIRLILGVIIIVCYVVCERSRVISSAVAAFLTPAVFISAVFFGAIYSGDVLVYLYILGAAMLSLTYLKPKSLLIYICYTVLAGSIILLLNWLEIVNMLGDPYTFTHNAIFFIATAALSFVIYIFCGSYTGSINSLVEAEGKAALAAKAKGNFLARMSHEIRTPLNAIIGLTETQLRKDLPKEELETMMKIQASGRLLLGIINDILDLSKIESGKFDLVLEEYVVTDMLYDIINLNMVRVGSKPIRFIIEIDPGIPCRLIGDSLRIKQLLSNLLSNAFKYTDEGSVTLGLTWSAENDTARLIFKITDTGIGMEPEDLNKLFSEYSQVNKKANKAIEGTGLGLSICKWLTELMGGQIHASSEFGKGSIFTAEIVQGVADTKSIGGKKAASLADFTYSPETMEQNLEYRSLPDCRVLIVDDVEINLFVAEALLEPYGMKVDCLKSGMEAVESIRNADFQYDLIFMDHMMPVMDGIETVAAIRALGSDYAKSIPIIALSANAIAGSEKMFIENGFQDFIAKPIDMQKLDNVLCKWLLKN